MQLTGKNALGILTLLQNTVVTGTVRDIVFRAQHAAISNPAIIIVGEVVNLPAALPLLADSRCVSTCIMENQK
ncbi:MAG: hypothetical protein ABI813_03645 [Bacteroidota bacterium]